MLPYPLSVLSKVSAAGPNPQEAASAPPCALAEGEARSRLPPVPVVPRVRAGEPAVLRASRRSLDVFGVQMKNTGRCGECLCSAKRNAIIIIKSYFTVQTLLVPHRWPEALAVPNPADTEAQLLSRQKLEAEKKRKAKEREKVPSAGARDWKQRHGFWGSSTSWARVFRHSQKLSRHSGQYFCRVAT